MKIQKPFKYTDEKRPGLFKRLLKVITFEYASLSILEILIILVIVGVGVFYIRSVFQKSYENNISGKIISLERCQQELRQNSEKYSYDKVKIANTTNILLALQDYNFDTGNLPKSLEILKEKEYLSADIVDPEYSQPYYYQRLSVEEYVLCIYLSTGTWGTNTEQCPTLEEFTGITTPTPSPMISPIATTSAKIIVIKESETGWVRIRKDPTLDGVVLTKAYPGNEFKFLEEVGKWVKVELKEELTVDGEVFDFGWIAKEYTEEK
jgi:hypothetical protein